MLVFPRLQMKVLGDIEVIGEVKWRETHLDNMLLASKPKSSPRDDILSS